MTAQKTIKQGRGENKRKKYASIQDDPAYPNSKCVKKINSKKNSTGEMKLLMQSEKDFASDTSHIPLQILVASHLSYPIPCWDTSFA